MRDKICNIVDFKRFVDGNNFKQYIIEVNHVMMLKLQFPLAKVCLAPDLIYFADTDGNYICFDKINTVQDTNDGVEICRLDNNLEQKIKVHYQYN